MVHFQKNTGKFFSRKKGQTGEGGGRGGIVKRADSEFFLFIGKWDYKNFSEKKIVFKLQICRDLTKIIAPNGHQHLRGMEDDILEKQSMKIQFHTHSDFSQGDKQEGRGILFHRFPVKCFEMIFFHHSFWCGLAN